MDEQEAARAEFLERLIDAIDLVKEDRRDEAYQILRGLIRDDNNFEDAWLWMSVAVDSLDQSAICLDNVLRVNPGNIQAAGALYRLRENEMLVARTRDRLRMIRDTAFGVMWLIMIVTLFAVLWSYSMMLAPVG
jgi:hypothetical protein